MALDLIALAVPFFLLIGLELVARARRRAVYRFTDTADIERVTSDGILPRPASSAFTPCSRAPRPDVRPGSPWPDHRHHRGGPRLLLVVPAVARGERPWAVHVVYHHSEDYNPPSPRQAVLADHRDALLPAAEVPGVRHRGLSSSTP
jgi:hypothetical protein